MQVAWIILSCVQDLGNSIKHLLGFRCCYLVIMVYNDIVSCGSNKINHALNTVWHIIMMSTKGIKYYGKISRRQIKSSSKQPSLEHHHGAWSSRQPTKSTGRLLNQKKKSPLATQYPEMVAADYDPLEPVHSVTPIVLELTKIKKRVNEVRLPWQHAYLELIVYSTRQLDYLLNFNFMHTLLNHDIVVFTV